MSFQNLFKKKRRIVITFTDGNDGKTITCIKFDKSIPVGYALSAVERLKDEIVVGLSHKLAWLNIKKSSPDYRRFIRSKKLGEILK